VMDTGSAVKLVASQCLPDKVLSLMLAEMAGGKRRDWKALLHQNKATRGGKVDDGRVYVRSATSLTNRLIGPCLERNGNGEAILCWRSCQMELRSRIR
jgi:hypothetical protein